MNRFTTAPFQALDLFRRPRALAVLAAAIPFAGLAGLPEPDVVVWGSVSLQGTPLTARRTDVVLEARDTSTGVTLASYRMGSIPAAGDHFVLRIPTQSGTPPPADPKAASLGSPNIQIQVATALQFLGQQPVAVPARGQFQRLDLAFSQGADANELPDDWENAYFGSTGQNPDADPDADGRTTREEFEAGTHPAQPDAPPGLEIARVDGRSVIAFRAAAALGPGYAGLRRLYSLESATELPGPPDGWVPDPSATDILGADQRVQITPVATDRSRFFRLRLRLTRAE